MAWANDGAAPRLSNDERLALCAAQNSGGLWHGKRVLHADYWPSANGVMVRVILAGEPGVTYHAPMREDDP
jgi:hypothetical protein